MHVKKTKCALKQFLNNLADENNISHSDFSLIPKVKILDNKTNTNAQNDRIKGSYKK